MRKLILGLVISLLVLSISGCAEKYKRIEYKSIIEFPSKSISVQIEPIITDSLLNIRAIEVVNLTDDIHGLVYLSSNGTMGTILPSQVIEGGMRDLNEIKISEPIAYTEFKTNLSTDSLKLNFRALAVDKNYGYGITIGSPALLYALDIDVEKNKIVYQEDHEKAFYDSLAFWNDKEGIAIGDPTEGCMSIIITRDGGSNWQKIPCEMLPDAKDGEAAFAASDTNIAIIGDHTWVATGGKASRILYSPDKGLNWEVFETPILQGKETTGMYSIDFYDAQNGFAIGGDYTDPDGSIANKIRTKDGGRTWEVVSNGSGPGYRSCVQYVPNGLGNDLVAIGFKGIDYSSDAGDTWEHLSDEGFYIIRFINDSTAFAAGKGRISKLVFKK